MEISIWQFALRVDFTQAEEDVKTGKLGDVLSVELLIVKYSDAIDKKFGTKS